MLKSKFLKANLQKHCHVQALLMHDLQFNKALIYLKMVLCESPQVSLCLEWVVLAFQGPTSKPALF